MNNKSSTKADRDFGFSEKFEQLVHFILWHCKEEHPQEDMDAMKMDKILWKLDVSSYCASGESLSGESFYIKETCGPVPPHILAVYESLHARGILTGLYDNEGNPCFDSCKVNEAPDTPKIAEYFDDEKLQLIKDFCKEAMPKSNEELSKDSHDSVYYTYELEGKIPLAAYMFSHPIKPTEEHLEWARAASDSAKGKA